MQRLPKLFQKYEHRLAHVPTKQYHRRCLFCNKKQMEIYKKRAELCMAAIQLEQIRFELFNNVISHIDRDDDDNNDDDSKTD